MIAPRWIPSWLQNDDQERRIRQNHTTIVKDEYKIEDLMDQQSSIPRSPHKFSCRTCFLKAADFRYIITSISCNPWINSKIQEVMVQDTAFEKFT